MDTNDYCVYCDRDTAFGTGLFVNRIPADRTMDDGTTRDGWMCVECQQIECDVCGNWTTDYTFTDAGDAACDECTLA